MMLIPMEIDLTRYGVFTEEPPVVRMMLTTDNKP